jgi:HemY protein
MIRLLLIFLALLGSGAAAAYYLRSETGYVLLSYGDWILETSLPGFVVGVFLLILVLYYGLKLLYAGVRLPETVRHYLQRRRAESARVSFERGLLKLLEGNWKRAEIELVRRAADHHAAHLNYLAAARAAQRLGAPDRRDHYLQLAAASDPALEFATLITRAELQRERGEHQQARTSAERLREQQPEHPYAIELLAESLAALGEWEPLRRLLAETTRVRALSPERRRELLLQGHLALLEEAVAQARLDRLKALWDAAPADARALPALRQAYAHGLARLNAQADAIALVLKTLEQDWDGELVTLYGELSAGDPVTQLANVEAWLNQYGERPELLVTAARACARNKLWGKARSYLEAVIRQQPTPAAYLELARVCEQTQQPGEAQQFCRQGLELAASQGRPC